LISRTAIINSYKSNFKTIKTGFIDVNGYSFPNLILMNLLLIKKNKKYRTPYFCPKFTGYFGRDFFIYEKMPTFVRNLPDISDGLLGKDRYG
jgi:hypothetical protein